MTQNVESIEQEFADMERMLVGACEKLVSLGAELGPQQSAFYTKKTAELRKADEEVWHQLTSDKQAAVRRHIKATTLR